ncbi:MAG: hypothetical protein ABR524_02100 [Thermoanaerobaculia bacterium]
MKKIILGSVALSLLLLLVILHLQVQPTGQARVLRSDQKLIVVQSRVGWTQGWAMQSCLVPVEDGRLRFKELFALTAAGGEGIEVDVDFTYRFPPSLPPRWPEGDWCRALSAATAGEIENWFTSNSSEESLSPPQAASGAAAALEKGLSRRGLEVEGVSVRPRLSPDGAQTHPTGAE